MKRGRGDDDEECGAADAGSAPESGKPFKSYQYLLMTISRVPVDGLACGTCDHALNVLGIHLPDEAVCYCSLQACRHDLLSICVRLQRCLIFECPALSDIVYPPLGSRPCNWHTLLAIHTCIDPCSVVYFLSLTATVHF